MRFFLLLLPLFFIACQPQDSEVAKVKMPQKPLEAKVEMHLNRPTIFINEEAQASVIYALTDMPGGRWTWEEMPQHNLAVFCERGVRMYQLDISFEQMWKKDGTMDISMAQRQIRGLLEVCPEAAVFFRLHVNAPFWWLDEHREELVLYADTMALPQVEYGLQSPLFGDPRAMERVSLASEKWLQESSKMTASFCQQLSKTPEGRAVIGIQAACGVYGEWHYWGFVENEPDVSEAMTQRFRKWAKEKYQNESNLQAAWQDETVTFASIEVPDVATRASTRGIFRHPQTEKYAADYFRNQHEMVADQIIHFCKIIKENWSRPIITGTFYGYFFSLFGREVAGGHLELRKILESEYVDYLSAPQSYGPKARKNGEVYRSRGLLTSCRLNEKLWLDEMDIEPNLHYFYLKDVDKYLSAGRAVTRRNMTYSLLKGMGLWFYDYGISGVEFDDFHLKYMGVSGWWDHPEVMKDIAAIKEIVEARIAAEKPFTSDADVLFIGDTESCYHTASLPGKNPLLELSMDWASLAAFRTGVAFDAIHLGDLEKVDWEQYKVVVFGNTYQLSDSQKAFIKNRVAKDNRQLVWTYAPAYITADSLDIAALSAVVGMELKQIELQDTVRLRLAKEPAQFLAGQNRLTCEVAKKPFAPAFALAEDRVRPLGYYQENGEVAIASKEMEGYTSWYIGAPAKEEQNNILRYILHQGKAHRYTDDPTAVVYAGWGLLFYYNHFKKDRRTGTVRLKNGKEVKFTSPNRACGVLLDAETGEILLEAS